MIPLFADRSRLDRFRHDMGVDEGGRQMREDLFPQGILVTVLCLLLLLSGSKIIPAIKRLGILAMITFGLLLPMFFLYAFTGTSDPRRVFIGMSFLSLFLAIFSLQDGFARKARDFVIALIVAMQIAGFLWCVKGAPPTGNSLLAQYHAAMRPKTNADQNEAVILHLMDLGVPKNSPVAVYTMALFKVMSSMASKICLV